MAEFAPAPPMTLGKMTSADYRLLADEEVALAKAAVPCDGRPTTLAWRMRRKSGGND